MQTFLTITVPFFALILAGLATAAAFATFSALGWAPGVTPPAR